MSKYAIPTISAADADIANSPALGQETRVFYSLDDVAFIGKLEQDGAGSTTQNNDRYWGFSASTSLANSAAVLALSSHDSGTSATKTFSISPTDDYVYFAYPKRFGEIASVLIDGIESSADLEAPATVAVTPVGGTAEDYYVYRTTNLLDATFEFAFTGETVSGSVAGGATYRADSAYIAPTSKTEGNDFQVVLTTALHSPDGAFSAEFNVTLAGSAIASSTSASPGVITTTSAHGLTTGDIIDISGVTGSGATVLNGNDRTVTVISSTTFSAGVNTTGVGSGGVFNKHTTATATFRPPAHVTDQGFQLPAGLAIDLNADGADSAKKIRTVDGVASVTNGAAGNVLEIHKLPSSASYVELGCVENFDVDPGSPEPVRIPCRENAARWIKIGRNSDPGFTASTKNQGFAEGASRIKGFRATLKVEVRKDLRLLSERTVLTDVISKVSYKNPEGSGVAMIDLTGSFSQTFTFC